MPFLPVGGQAVVEGVMMRAPSRIAVAVRRGDGSLAFMDRSYESVTRRYKGLGLPIVRGAVSLFETMYLGILALNFSADEAARDEPASDARTKDATAKDATAKDATSKDATAKDATANPGGKPAGGFGPIVQGVTIVFSLALGLLLFVVLPAKLTGWLGFHGRIGFGLVDGLFRLLAFVLYLTLISQWKEMARVLGFHGAEHKAIHAVEAGVPLTPENVQKFPRLHPRCGTTFLFLVVVVSILVFTLLGRPTSLVLHLQRIACMPLIAGVAFEFIRLSGRYFDRPWVRVLTWPGMQFQLLTTREPDLEMCAVAIASLERVLDDPTVIRMRAEGGMKEMSFIQ